VGIEHFAIGGANKNLEMSLNINTKYIEEACYNFVGASEKLREAAVSFVMSVCTSAWNNSAPNGRIFMKFYI
jgi:hypothetical protein